MRILHVTHSLNIGGLERVVVDLAKEFGNRGHEVHICCLSDKEPLAAEAERAGAFVFSLNKEPGPAFGLPLRIAGEIRKRQVDVIHTHNAAGLIYGVTAALVSGARCIVHTEHGKEPESSQSKVRASAEKFLIGKTTRIVTVSEQLRKDLILEYDLPAGRIKVILNGINAERFRRPECREKTRLSMGIENGGVLIGHIARLVPLKNQKFLITIFGELKKIHPEVRLAIAGGGPLMNELRSFAEKERLSGDVLFLGERRDIPEILSALDLFILPSLTEGISITLLEAMAAGVPVVASRVGGNEEIIEHGRSGILISPDEPRAWIEHIGMLLRNESERIRLAEAAGGTVRKRFSTSAMAEEYEHVYLSK
ncbi:MAG: glycosyltransferase [Syntrophales bacterium]|nr:glycosyltransferase [Syntrophales bacterium]MDD5232434.1 glycosyltransferase [Syntrophales bacterium]MDD5531153.1 glycosyltransferase [Syntrophales bacterium]